LALARIWLKLAVVPMTTWPAGKGVGVLVGVPTIVGVKVEVGAAGTGVGVELGGKAGGRGVIVDVGGTKVKT
jgi:hypothetical protein